MTTITNKFLIVLTIALRAPFAVRFSDISLFLRSGRTDAGIIVAKRAAGARYAFETAYTTSGDPWGSTDPRFGYQRRKYEAIMGLLPPSKRYARVLDLGSGLGNLTRLLASRSDHVLGLDLAQAAVDLANSSSGSIGNLEYRQGDVNALPAEMNGQFNLVVIADTLYYLNSTDKTALDLVSKRLTLLLAPGGMVLIANHYFSPWDAASRLTRSIHDTFIKGNNLRLISERYRPFFLASLIQSTV